MDNAADKAAELAACGGLNHVDLPERAAARSSSRASPAARAPSTRRKMLASGTNIVGGVNARKAGTDRRRSAARTCRSSAPSSEAMKETGADVVGRLRAAEVRQGRRDRGDRRRDRAGRGHHRGHPGARLAPTSGRTPCAKGNKTRIIGPNCPGIISPGKSNAGIIPADITGPGQIGLVSKSGTLTYQMMYELRDIGFSTAIGIGGDPIIGTTHIDALEAFEADPETEAIVMIGEIGGDAEERAAAFIKANVTKPVVGYVAGFTAPEGKTMGHAGAIVSGSAGTAQAKKEALEAAGRQGRQDAERDRRADAGDHRRALSRWRPGPPPDPSRAGRGLLRPVPRRAPAWTSVCTGPYDGPRESARRGALAAMTQQPPRRPRSAERSPSAPRPTRPGAGAAARPGRGRARRW